MFARVRAPPRFTSPRLIGLRPGRVRGETAAAGAGGVALARRKAAPRSSLSLSSENLAAVGTWQVASGRDGMGWGPAGRGCARVGRVRPREARAAATGGAARLAPAISLLSPMDALQPAMSGCQRPVAARRRTGHQGDQAVLENTLSERGGANRRKAWVLGCSLQDAGCSMRRCVCNYIAGRIHPLESEDGAKNRLDKKASDSSELIRLRFSISRFRRPVELKLIYTRRVSRARHLSR